MKFDVGRMAAYAFVGLLLGGVAGLALWCSIDALFVYAWWAVGLWAVAFFTLWFRSAWRTGCAGCLARAFYVLALAAFLVGGVRWLLFRGDVRSVVLPYWGLFWVSGAAAGVLIGVLAEVAPKSWPVRLSGWVYDQCSSLSEDDKPEEGRGS